MYNGPERAVFFAYREPNTRTVFSNTPSQIWFKAKRHRPVLGAFSLIGIIIIMPNTFLKTFFQQENFNFYNETNLKSEIRSLFFKTPDPGSGVSLLLHILVK